MSILIKGMKMPKTCCHCPLMGYDSDREWFDGMAKTGAYICALTGELIDNTKREEHCPLIEIPPHGRLIDADASIDVAEGHVSPGQTKISAFLLNHIEGLVPRVVIPAEEGADD